MKQRTAAPQQPTVAYARAFGGAFCSIGDATTATNLSARRLGMRTT